MQRKYHKYNIENLKPFTTENASYYGKKGGIASGKSKLKKKIDTTRLSMAMIIIDIEPYRQRKRIYKRELDYIKSQVHHYKILNNRYNKLIDLYNKKYAYSESKHREY